MSEWKRVKIGEFLNQYRNTIYVEDEKNYGQITISKHDGVQFRGNKKGKDIGRKRQFLIDLTIYPNTLIFTRQGVADGSIGFAPESVNGCIATENMPMFSIDEKIILKEYFSLILKSDIFMDEVAEITPTGSAQKSIHENQLLQLEITIPKTIEEQKRIVKELISKIEKVDSTSAEIDKQKSYAKQLRQSVLQDAIEGKLTADWRKSHTVEKGNSDYDAEALFQKIQEEKQKQATGKKKSSEKLAEISDEEKPFPIPTGWKWVRLGEIAESSLGKMLDIHKNKGVATKYLRNLNVRWFSFDLSDVQEMRIQESELEKYTAYKGDLLVCEGGYPGRSAIWMEDYSICFQKAVHRIRFYLSKDINKLFNFYLYLLSESNELEQYITGAGIRHLTGKELKTILFPLPSLAEQTEIVRRVETQLDKITQLEQQIASREELTKQLMRNILRDAFEGER